MPKDRTYGAQSMVERLRRILVKPPVETKGDVKRWRPYHYVHEPNPRRTLKEWEEYVAILRDEVGEVLVASKKQKGALDSVFVQDPAMVLDKGALVCRMGNKVRRVEEKAAEEDLKAIGVPIKWRIKAPGTVEGGDCLWLDGKDLAVGIAYRTNMDGARQLQELLKGTVTVHTVHLPHWEGPETCFHLQSLVSMVDRRTALAHKKMLPVVFLHKLKELGIDIIEVVPEEFDGLAPNVLALRPGRVIMLAGYPKTRGRLVKAGIDVITFKAPELCSNRTGGATCLTRSILRDRPRR